MEKPTLENLTKNQLSETYIKTHFPEYYKYLKINYLNLDWKDALYLDMHSLSNIPRCPICGKEVSLISFFKGYNKYCSKECCYKNDTRLNNIQSTIKKRYGVSHALQSKEFLLKAKQTCKDRYGDKNYNNRPLAKQTMISNYGGWGSQSELIKKKSSQTRRMNRINNNIIPDHIGYTEDGMWVMKCDCSCCDKECDKTYIIGSTTYFDRTKHNNILCTKLNPVLVNKTKDTTMELFIRSILDKNNIKYECNNRTILNGKELDIYIPSHHIAFECNGVYWHSIKPSSYHVNKWKECCNKNIQLIQIWEDWYTNKREILESIIESKLGIYKCRIGARQCVIREINSEICNVFLNDNHIQGHGYATVHLGLYYNDELVSVMTFARQKNDEWCLNRFCSLKGHQIIGGANRLVKYFITTYHPSTITSYSSNDISNGNLYKKLGFDRVGLNQSYWYIDKNNLRRYHRSSFSKSKLMKLGYDVKNSTESQIMQELPYFRISDAGTIKWSLNVLLLYKK